MTVAEKKKESLEWIGRLPLLESPMDALSHSHNSKRPIAGEGNGDYPYPCTTDPLKASSAKHLSPTHLIPAGHTSQNAAKQNLMQDISKQVYAC